MRIVFCAALVLCSACLDYSGHIALRFDDTLPPNVVDAARGAADVWESRTGLDLFIEVSEANSPHVTVTEMSAGCVIEGAHRLGATDKDWTGDDNSMRGTVQLCVEDLDSAPSHFVVGIVAHEFGHLLRLEHESDQSNVMRANVDGDWPWHISDAQVEQVRDTTHAL